MSSISSKTKTTQTTLMGMMLIGVLASAIAVAQTAPAPKPKAGVPTRATSQQQAQPQQRMAPMAYQANTSTLVPAEGDLYSSLSQSTSAFDLRNGETVRDALTRWCEDSGWTLVWKAKQDYQIDINLSFPQGTTLKTALRDTTRALWLQHPEIRATTYKNNVVVVDEVAK